MRLIADRGIMSVAPENTVAAFAACAERKVTAFRTSAGLLADGTLVCIADTTLGRTTNLSGAWSGRTFSEIRRADAGAWYSRTFRFERVPELVSVLSLAAQMGVEVFVELHDSARTCDLVDAVEASLRAAPAAEVTLFSADARVLAELARRGTNATLGIAVDANPDLGKGDTVTEGGLVRAALTANPANVERLNALGVDVYYDEVDGSADPTWNLTGLIRQM
ncbi:MAG: glycerophosphodiester phosphodiesterase family protein [Actinomycetaceae bacterium]|nr:glycerophosphodiester phosphodiesterase family protein [Actinomycetaceae bacterium]